MKRIEREIISTKRNISNRARTTLKNGPPTSTSPDPIKRKDLTRGEEIQIWLDHAEEGYVLAGILAYHVIQSALLTRNYFPPYGLVTTDYPNSKKQKAVENIESIYSLSDSFLISLRLSKEEFFERLREGDAEVTPEMIACFQRYEKIHGFSERYFRSPKIDISQGTRTAIIRMENAMGNIITLLARKLGENASIRDVLQTARNSWPYIGGNAAVHLHTLRASSEVSKKPSFHELMETEKGYQLTYTTKALEKIGENERVIHLSPTEKRPTYGCVGLIDFGEGNAVHKLWNWYTDAAIELYDRNFQGKPITSLFGEPSPYVNI